MACSIPDDARTYIVGLYDKICFVSRSLPLAIELWCSILQIMRTVATASLAGVELAGC